MNCGSKDIFKNAPISCTNTNHDVTDLVNHGMVKIQKLDYLENETIFLRNKKVPHRWHILSSHRFVVEVNLNPLSANHTKWSNTVKQFVGNLPTNCLIVFDHFVILALKVLINSTRVVKVSLYDQFLAQGRIYFFLIFPNQEESNAEVSVKYLLIVSRISTLGTH